MNPIGRNNLPPNVPQSTPAGNAAPADKTEKAFEVPSGAPAGNAQQAQAAAGPIRPNFERMAKLIQSGQAQSMSRDELREHVISGETEHLFGEHASPDMKTAVAEAFKDDPQLAQVLNTLLSKAGG